LLSALSMAENGQMSRFSALRAMGLGRYKKSFSALSKAINALTEEGRVQKIGGAFRLPDGRDGNKQ